MAVEGFLVLVTVPSAPFLAAVAATTLLAPRIVRDVRVTLFTLPVSLLCLGMFIGILLLCPREAFHVAFRRGASLDILVVVKCLLASGAHPPKVKPAFPSFIKQTMVFVVRLAGSLKFVLGVVVSDKGASKFVGNTKRVTSGCARGASVANVDPVLALSFTQSSITFRKARR